MLRVNRNGKSALQWDKVIDSNKKEAFGSGSMRDSQEGKGRYDLIPTGAIHRLAQHYETGAKKYAERNWEKGQPLQQYYNSAIRHLQALRDADLSEDHAAAAVWNIVAIMHHIDKMLVNELPIELDSFGIVKQILAVETAQALAEYAYPRDTYTITADKITTKWTPVFASGVAPQDGLLPEYKAPDIVAFDKGRFQEQSSKVRRTVKLDPEELG